MFKASLIQEHERDLRFKKEQLTHVVPDAGQRIHWLQRWKLRLWTEARLARSVLPEVPALIEPELFVPDDRLGLFIQDGVPLRVFQPGRYRFTWMKAKVELRLIPMDALPDRAHGDQLHIVQDLPYERAFLYVDGTLVSIVKPGLETAKSPSHWVDRRVPLTVHTATSYPLGAEEDEDLVQGFSFV